MLVLYLTDANILETQLESMKEDASCADCVLKSMQAGLTDNTPIYILGGNILPFGQGGMTTSQAKASPLTLVAALANATSVNTTDRCSGKCSIPQARFSATCYDTMMRTACPAL